MAPSSVDKQVILMYNGPTVANYPSMEEVFRGTRLREALVAASPKHTAFNSCIAWSPVEGYRLLVRDSGYCMSKDNLQYFMPDPDGTIRTTTLMCSLDADLNICAVEPIDDESVSHVEWPLVRGVEDSRLYWSTDGSWHRYGTLREAHWSGQCQIAEDWLDGPTVTKRVVHEGPLGLDRAEKNWTKMVGEDDWYVYLCGPSQIYNPHTKQLLSAPWDVQPIAQEFRGGSPAIPYIYTNRRVAIVHEVTWHPRPREYWHRFVMFDEHGFLTHYSPAFYFKAPGIEFAAGLVRHRGDLVASFGFAEHRNFLAYFPIEEVEAKWIDARL